MMKLKSIQMLLLMPALMLAVGACGGGISESDIDARLTSINVVPTDTPAAEPLPIYTPYPTYTPAPVAARSLRSSEIDIPIPTSNAPPALAPEVVVKMQASTDTEGLPSEWEFLSEVFSKYVNVFGVNIFATKDTPDSKVRHASNVLAQYLDNNADEKPDNPAVINAMTQVNASIIMVAWENDMETVIRQVPERFHEMIDTGRVRVQDLYGEETDPPRAAGSFDASLEEILHLITSVGYAQTYPDVFGEEAGSTIARYMDNARGGHFEELRDSDCDDDEPNESWQEGQCALPPNGEYPEDAWYTYLDPTCSYGCMVTEYFYWALTALVGAQSSSQRCNDISDEWVLCNNKHVKSRDPDIYTLLTDSRYALPTILPDGNYFSSPP